MKSEIVPYAYPKYNKDVCEIGIEKMSITYIQPDDTNHGGEGDIQTITIETEDAVCTRSDAEKEQSYYLVLKTDRWAIEDANDLRVLIEDFNSKLYNTVRNKKKTIQNEENVECGEPIIVRGRSYPSYNYED